MTIKKKGVNEELEKVQEEKTKEAQELYDRYEIKPVEYDDYPSVEIPSFNENSNSKDKEPKYHWTRLSINSSGGCVIE
ncbi:MAG: hypothetical protein GDA42_00165 [Ekhidna sp.]|nr:hypothetical protein [Ekhidna sp.]